MKFFLLLNLVASLSFGSYYEAFALYVERLSQGVSLDISTNKAPSISVSMPDLPEEIITSSSHYPKKETVTKNPDRKPYPLTLEDLKPTKTQNLALKVTPKTDVVDSAPTTEILEIAKTEPAEALKESEVLTLLEPEVETRSIKGEDHPLAFSSLFDKNYDGQNFTLVEELQRTDFSRNYSISYEGDGLTLSGTLHVPFNQGKGPFPLIVLNRGFYPTIVYNNGFGFSFEQDYFARRGYAALHLDFRGYGFSENRTDYINGRGLNYYNYTVDLINAIEAIKAADLPSINTDSIGLFGLSMGGGILTAALVAQPDIAQVGLAWGPVSSDYYDNYNKWEYRRLSAEDKALLTEAFGPLDDPESFKALSVRPYLNRLKAPIEIHQGLADKDTPPQWSQQTIAELERLGKEYMYRQYPGEPHIFIGRSWSRAIANALLHFDKHLQPEDFVRPEVK